MNSTGPGSESGAGHGRHLDFIVIGAQKGGTTSLWQHLRGHPGLFMPRAKEAPFFIYPDAARSGALDEFMRKVFVEAPEGALLGKATPDYMLGRGEIQVEVVADRIAASLPDVRLIALLRDPIERALSNYTMEVRRGQERREAATALSEQLGEGALGRSRQYPTFTNAYVIQGEYGRILEVFRSRFGADRLLIAYTEELRRSPGELLDKVLAFLGVPGGHRPEGLGARHFGGGSRRRVDAAAEAELFAYMRREVLPHMEGDLRAHADAFGFFFETWNVVPGDALPPLPVSARARLEQHFRADAERLAGLGIPAPWIAEWDA